MSGAENVRVETHRDGEKYDNAAREAGMTIEDFMLEVVDARFRELVEDKARERGISVEQWLAELPETDEDQEREDALLESLDWDGSR